MKFTAYLVLLCVVWLNGIARQPVLYFKRLNHANGLSNDKVNCILQDKRGFIWIGTDDGLNRYDGNNFLIFKNIPGQSSSISGNTITDLHEDRDGVLWIATADGGISRYDYRLPSSIQFRQFKHNPDDKTTIPVNIVNALLEDDDGYLWLATSGAAVLRFDKKREQFQRPQGLAGWTINDLVLDGTGRIWAGREGGSILRIDRQKFKGETDPRYANFYEKLPHVVVTRLYRDSRKNIWFGSWDKAVYRYNELSGMEESFASSAGRPYSFGSDEPIAFNEDRQGNIWIGGKYGGLYLFDPSTGNFYNYQHNSALEGTLSGNNVRCIFTGRSGETWIGTQNGISIHQADKQPFLQQFLVASGKEGTEVTVYDFLRRQNGELWIGTSKGLFRQAQEGTMTHHPLQYKGVPVSITCFYEDENQVYFGTDYTLFAYNERRNVLEALPNTEKDQVMSRLIESRITSIVRDTIDGHPVLITSPYGHFFTFYDLAEQRWISRRDSLKRILDRYQLRDNLIRKIFRTRDGRLWMANAKNGLLLVNKNTRGNTAFVNNPSSKQSISNNNVFDLKEDDFGNLWISTYGGGLNYFDTRKRVFQHFASTNNLFEGLQVDRKGQVWCINNGNLQLFDPATHTFTYVELPDVEKSGGVKGTIYKDDAGILYVAGNGYYISFDPETVKPERVQPDVYLTDFSIFDESNSQLLSAKEVALNYNQNFFTFHFSAPCFAAAAPVQYSYMLQGVDKDWVNAGSSTQAPYTNLGSGSYIFKVRATTTPGTWSEKVTTIRIRIIPPFWKRWWFYLLLTALISAIVYALYRYRINELLKRQAIRNKIAQDLHDNVGSTLSSISVYSQVARIYREKGRYEELQQTLDKIGSTSGEMISEMNDIVWVINPRNDSMNTILSRMESYAKPLLSAQGIHYRFQFAPELVKLHLPMGTRKNFYLVFKEAINNAVKYSQASNVEVRIEYRHHRIVMEIRDDGRGFDPSQVTRKAGESLSGNGLGNMRARAEEMKGELRIESSPGNGTRLELQFPVT